MSININVGEIGITSEGRTYKFRPSFYALTQIGNPKRLVEIYNSVFSYSLFYIKGSSFEYNGHGVSKFTFMDAITCLQAFYDGDDDISHLIGCYTPSERRVFVYRAGSVPFEDIMLLAQTLLKNAMIGRPKRRAKGNSAAKLFDPGEYVGVIGAHLGYTPDIAWKMTMIEFQQAMDAKYPPEDKPEDYPDSEEYDALMKLADDAHARLQ